MGGNDEHDDLVEFDARTRVDDGAFRAELLRKPESSVSLDGRPEETRVVAPPMAASDAADTEEEPARTVLIESPFAEPPSPPPLQAFLVVVEGNDRGKEFPLAGNVIVVGRSLECDVVLNDPSVSRRHFEVQREGDRWLMKDLGSGNGTRVNGERVPTIVLDVGMRIEAGQTVLGFQMGEGAAGGDEESTRAIDLPGGRVPVPEPPKPPARPVEPPRAEPKPAAPPPAQIRPGKAPTIQVVDGPAPSPRRAVWPVAVGIALAILVGVAVAQFGFGIRILPVGEEPAKPAAVADGASAANETADRMARGLKALEDRQWDPAIAILADVKQADPSVPGLDDAITRARDEKRSSSLLDAAKGALEKESLDEARGLLARIPDKSVYRAEASGMLNDLDSRLVTAAIESVKALARAGKKAEARQGFVTLVTDHPDDSRILPLRAELVAAGIALDPIPGKTASTAAAASGAPAPAPAAAPARVADAEASAAPARPGRLDVSRALSQYDRGLFQQAAADLRSARARGEELSKAQGLADRIERFAEAYSEGKSALEGKRLDRAESGLSQALRLDQEIDGHYSGEVRGLLGDTYRSRAAAAIQNADYVLASRSARRALSYRADDDLAGTILDKCLVVAQKQYDAAAADAKAGRKDAAREKARVVLDILQGSKGHPLEEKAAALLR